MPLDNINRLDARGCSRSDLQVDLSIVDSAPVVESAVSLGWMEQPQDGLYWVETTEDFFVVHGLVSQRTVSTCDQRSDWTTHH